MLTLFKRVAPRSTPAHPLLRHFSTSQYEGNFRERAAGTTQLKEFYKFTHPDFFGGAPDVVRETNEQSMQSLNAHLQATQTLNQVVQ